MPGYKWQMKSERVKTPLSVIGIPCIFNLTISKYILSNQLAIMSELSIRALLNKLSRNLAVLKETISLENGVGNFSANGLSETAIMKIYNIAAGLELTNANLI